MKTVKLNATAAIVILISLLWIACKDDDFQSHVEVEAFKVEVVNDTVPSEVLVIKEISTMGRTEFTLMHKGAYSSLENGEQIDSSWSIYVNPSEITYLDTLSLFYLEKGVYQISMEANGKLYSESFELFSK